MQPGSLEHMQGLLAGPTDVQVMWWAENQALNYSQNGISLDPWLLWEIFSDKKEHKTKQCTLIIIANVKLTPLVFKSWSGTFRFLCFFPSYDHLLFKKINPENLRSNRASVHLQFTTRPKERRKKKKLPLLAHCFWDKCMRSLIGTHTWRNTTVAAHVHTHKQGGWHMVYQQAQLFCPLASFSDATALGARRAFVLNVTRMKKEKKLLDMDLK